MRDKISRMQIQAKMKAKEYTYIEFMMTFLSDFYAVKKEEEREKAMSEGYGGIEELEKYRIKKEVEKITRKIDRILCLRGQKSNKQYAGVKSA